MSNLVSPGVAVTVAEDTFTPASGPGTVPLVVIATAQDKLVPGSSSIVAEGTSKANAGKIYTVTSQREVLQTFGVPVFHEESGSVLQGDELNEYGLHALFSAMGLTNRAQCIRADLDLGQLVPTQVEPVQVAASGTQWIDFGDKDFSFGLFKHNGGTSTTASRNYTKVNVLYPTSDVVTGSVISSDFGSEGDFAILVVDADLTIYTKLNGVWGTVSIDASFAISTRNAPTGNETFWFRLDSSAGGFNPVLKTKTASGWATSKAVVGMDIIDIERKFDGVAPVGTVAFISDSMKFVKLSKSDAAVLFTEDDEFDFAQDIVVKYKDGEVTITAVDHNDLKTKLIALGFTHSVKDGFVTITHPTSFSITNDGQTTKGKREWDDATALFAQVEEPVRTAADGQLWFDDSLYVDLLIQEGGVWKAMAAREVIIAQSEPSTRDGVAPLEDGDVWVDPVDGTNMEFYMWDASTSEWILRDKSDQSTDMGILFADARGSIKDGTSYFNSSYATATSALRGSSYVDPFCPDPREYPEGMLLVNMMQTGGVVREYVAKPFMNYDVSSSGSFSVGGVDQILAGSVTDGRWMTRSGNAADGSGLFGRKAQRKVITEAMAATIAASEELRAETIDFNLLVAPGYFELFDELVGLNLDRKETAYIITDVPSRLKPTATAINAWAKNMDNAPENGEVGRITRYAYGAQYMGWGMGTNADGKSVVIPGSTIALRTYLYSDSVSFQWFPPAGTERGVVTNASSIGYITDESEYAPVIYNNGQRDAMYLNNINPIAMRPDRGLLVYGDKSLSPNEGALDRVNVGRLVVYIRKQIDKIAERFLFKLNTPRTREEFKAALDAFLANIAALEGLEDFIVVCDESNNTALRRQRNELWADIAIVPTKSINFVYVPIRIRNAE